MQLLLSAGREEIDRNSLPVGPAAANPPRAAAAVNRRDERTDRQTDGHCIVTQTLPNTIRTESTTQVDGIMPE